MTKDMTQGSPLKLLLACAVPLMLGSLFQQFYNLADTFIVGRFVGVEALAAVGSVGGLNYLVLGFVNGIACGFSIPISWTFGAHDHHEMRRYTANAVWLSIFFAAVLTVVTVAMTRSILVWTNTPDNIIDLADVYIRTIFVGIPFTLLYNMTSALLRALGDSTRPLYFLLVASFLNIGLDWLFIVPLGMGVEGAAIATVVSQLFSGLLCTWWFFTKVEDIHFTRENCVLSGRHCKRLAYIGFPMGFEYSVSAIGAVIMQDAINLLGSTAVAAQTAGEKIRQMFTLPMESVGMAMATYVGQNHGARRTDRIRQGIKDGCMVQLLYCAVAWGVIFFIKPYAVGLVLGDADPAVTAGAIQYLSVMSMLFCFHGLLMIFRNTLQGLGYSVLAIVSGVGELIGRSLGGVLAVKTSLGYLGICLSNPFAWGLAMFYCLFMVCRILRRETQTEA